MVEERAKPRWLRSERSERLETTGACPQHPGPFLLRRSNGMSITGVAWAYILRCSDGSYYVGSTVDLERRISEHDQGLGAAYTRKRRPVALAWAGEFDRIDEAFAFEKRLQGWSRRKREALIEGRVEILPVLASRRRRARGGRQQRQG